MKEQLEKSMPEQRTASNPKKYKYLFLLMMLTFTTSLLYFMTPYLLDTSVRPQSNLPAREPSSPFRRKPTLSPDSFRSSEAAPEIRKEHSQLTSKHRTESRKAAANRKNTDNRKPPATPSYPERTLPAKKTDPYNRHRLTPAVEQPAMKGGSAGLQFLPGSDPTWEPPALLQLPAVKPPAVPRKDTYDRPGQTKRFQPLASALWKVNLPAHGSRNLMLTANKIEMTGVHLLPEFQARAQVGKRGEITASVSAFNLYSLPKQPFHHITPQPTGDSMLENRVNQITKIATVSAGLAYSVRMGKNWTAGAGTALERPVRAQMAQTNYTGSQYANRTDSLFLIRKTSPEWHAVSRSVLTGRFHAGYRKGPLGVGAAIVVPAKSWLKEKNVRPLHFQLFIRWDLFGATISQSK